MIITLIFNFQQEWDWPPRDNPPPQCSTRLRDHYKKMQNITCPATPAPGPRLDTHRTVRSNPPSPTARTGACATPRAGPGHGAAVPDGEGHDAVACVPPWWSRHAPITRWAPRAPAVALGGGRSARRQWICRRSTTPAPAPFGRGRLGRSSLRCICGGSGCRVG